MITQTLALFKDAYHELNAKKLFWIVLILSGLFVVGMACLGNDAKGLNILFWHIDIEVLSTSVIPRPMFYKLLFVIVGIKIWLTWAATVLALISTAGIIPDFIGGGSIELALSKPISRFRLFLTKYLTGLLFVGLQVGVFSLGVFLVIGVKTGDWSWRLFLGVPLVMVFFSYLYCVCVVIGLLTRSTIAALLLTVLFWLSIFLVNLAETGILLEFKIRYDMSVSLQETRLAERSADLKKYRQEREDLNTAEPKEGTNPEADKARLDEKIASLETVYDRRQTRLETDRRTQRQLTVAHAIAYAIKTILPKTSETTELLGRALVSKEDADRLLNQTPEPPSSPFGESERDLRISERAIQKEIQRVVRSRTVGWVVGTSLAFEAVILGIAAWSFCRRDF